MKKAHGLDPENDYSPLGAITLDVGDLTLAVTNRQELDCGPCGPPMGIETLALIPRTAAMRARLDALPTLDPYEWGSDEDAERLGLKREPHSPTAEMSRTAPQPPATGHTPSSR